ncbi:hypothetical protein O7635_29870 [Asanoa sp. WMMD1127]|uniref:hypothetical protein n=1 Tax=Asanoa sp. WMMD1127 TaxID=3016107 RepID=UPI0024169890|nr:hypothetical protein [Asanoa sp. WMMD1127]MDG4826077.1 hypothetical protein [Asanoa sp. WMMD1127]
MTDDWTWDDGHHDDPGHHDPGFEEHHDLRYDGTEDTDPFGADLGGGDLAGHDDLPGHDDLGAADWDAGDGLGAADDPFAPDALVSDHHDWAAGLDDDGDSIGPVEPAGLFGADPDVAAYALWPAPEFPAPLDLGADLPAPVDGPPWTDAALLGSYGPADLTTAAAPEPSDLAGYAGLDPATAGWEALAGSDDPATAALARFWAPPPA